MSAVRNRKLRTIFAAAIAAFGVATLGAFVTDLSPWYYSLHKPTWQPPDWAFGPAWTVIFSVAAMSGVLAWWGAPTRAIRLRIFVLFAINALFNVAWSWLFFRLHRPDWALLEVGFFWVSILVLMAGLWSASKAASGLLTIYLAWVAFAALLNLSVVKLNQPFN